MEQPRGFVKQGQEHPVCRLNKSLYGLKQAPRQWNLALHNCLTAMGFKRLIVEPCIYVKGQGPKAIFLGV